MTVAEMLYRMSRAELTEWMAVYRIEAQEREEQAHNMRDR
jgi:hypothetical protein